METQWNAMIELRPREGSLLRMLRVENREVAGIAKLVENDRQEIALAFLALRSRRL